MYASYCSTLRDNTALLEAERETRIRAYYAELRSTLREPPVKGVPTAANDPQAAAPKELARIPLAYTPEAFFDSVGKRKPAVALLFLKAGVDPDSADRQGRTALMAGAGSGDVAMWRSSMRCCARAPAPTSATRSMRRRWNGRRWAVAPKSCAFCWRAARTPKA